MSETTVANTTPTANDGITRQTSITNSAGTLVEAFRQTERLSTTTAGAETAQVFWALRSAGALTNQVLMTATSIAPVTNGAVALGVPTLGWSGACFSANTALNWGNGTYTVTQGGTAITGSGSAAFGSFVKTGVFTYGTLPAAETAGNGARAMITDCNSTTFLANAAAGGANIVPVVSNGTNWLIG